MLYSFMLRALPINIIFQHAANIIDQSLSFLMDAFIKHIVLFPDCHEL